MTRGWTGLWTTVIALGLVACTTSGAGASSLINYSTSGSVGLTNITGDGVISFNSVGSGAFTSPSSFSLGEFMVAALPEGTSTTYANTPFNITFLSRMIDGVEPVPNNTPVSISGVLNGQVTGDNQSTVVATVDPTSIPNFQTGIFTNTLTVNDLNLSLVPSTSNGGRTTAQGHLVATPNAQPIPEPTTIALFLTTLAGLGLRHRVRAGRTA